MKADYQIISSNAQHLEELARIYQDAFPDSLYVRFGKRYCKQMLNWFLSRPDSLFHLQTNGEIAGFYGIMIYDRPGLAGSTSSIIRFTANEAIKAVLRNPLRLFDRKIMQHATLIIKNLLFNVKNKVFHKKQEAVMSESDSDFVPYMSLVAIGVHSGHQNKGYGKALLKHLISLSEQKNIHKIRLTVRAENAQAIAAYKSCGFYQDGAHDGSIGMTLLLT